MFVCIPLCTTVVHNTACSSSDNISLLPSDNHHSSDAVYWRRRRLQQQHNAVIDPAPAETMKICRLFGTELHHPDVRIYTVLHLFHELIIIIIIINRFVQRHKVVTSEELCCILLYWPLLGVILSIYQSCNGVMQPNLC